MSDTDEDYEAKPENGIMEDSTQRDRVDKDKIHLNEDRAFEIINVEYSTLTDWLTKEIKKLRGDCNRLIDKTDFKFDDDDDN